MPSSSSFRKDPSLPHLSEIIQLEPEKEPWCAGFAPSQGRRCHARTNAYRRSQAMSLLNEGTKELRAGRSIDALLEDLAPHVLCRRFHQSQASDLVARWQKQIRSCRLSLSPSVPSSGRSGQRTRTVRSENQAEYLDEDHSTLIQLLLEAQEDIRQLRASLREPIIEVPAAETRVSRATGHSDAGSLSRMSTSSSSSSSSEGPRETSSLTRVTVQSTSATRSQVNNAARRPVHQQNTSRSTSTLTSISPIESVSDRSRRQEAQRVRKSTAPVQTSVQTLTPTVHRRSIEGDCGICLSSLQGSDNSDGESEEGDEHDDHSDGGRGLSGEHEEERDILWCKARCGVNFHGQCLRPWLERSSRPTCPTCRSTWKD